MAAIIRLHWCLAFLLFVLPAASSLTVEGLKGSSVTLPCDSSNRENLTTLLTFGPIIAYGLNQHEHFRGRVHKSGSCDLILQDLKTTDAGKYISEVYANSQLPDSYTFDVRVKVNLTGRTGEELMFDELPREAESVKHFTNPDWTEVWRREQGVLTDRLTIKNFSSSDAGTYRVLNSSGGILLTVTVTEPSTSSKDKLDSKHEDEPHDTKRVPVGVWIVIGVLVVLVVLIVFAVKKHDSYQEVPTQEPEKVPTKEPEKVPTEEPEEVPTEEPEKVPTKEPEEVPTEEPEKVPTKEPEKVPTKEPEEVPTKEPEKVPTKEPEKVPTEEPEEVPTKEPEKVPTEEPEEVPTKEPEKVPTKEPEEVPTEEPEEVPTKEPEKVPTEEPEEVPTKEPEEVPTKEPEKVPTKEPEK